MNILVTGAAGFIGSNLTERLLSEGHQVIGIDCFADYYARTVKENNLTLARHYRTFKFIEKNLLEDLSFLDSHDFEIVYHLAAQAGVRTSWGSSFQIYTDYNILATQRLLDYCLSRTLKRFIYASSSSVYGTCAELPLVETARPQPVSPYGVSKLAGENLVQLYHRNFGLATVSLRYFTVYGPRQRPDMAFHKFIRHALNNEPISLYGDGLQTRDFTYIDDIVTANINAIQAPPGSIINIGGGCRVTLTDAIELIQNVAGLPIKIIHKETQKGDMRHTFADIVQAQSLINYKPQTPLSYGLTQEFNWLKNSR
ncbi:NAD-dependent epimerase/dehydratase family protein [bacterium]|nr:NAD-dependent epimerase/dehydratase family protein [bacterium]